MVENYLDRKNMKVPALRRHDPSSDHLDLGNGARRKTPAADAAVGRTTMGNSEERKSTHRCRDLASRSEASEAWPAACRKATPEEQEEVLVEDEEALAEALSAAD